MGTNVDPGVIARLVAGVKYVISGVGGDNFFGPSQPLPPQAQTQAEGRAFDFPVGYNLRQTPRSGEAVSFGQLRAFARGYDLMRLVIEKRKDQIESFDWEIVPKDPKGKTTGMEADIQRVTNFMQRPDQEHDWAQWLRMQVEDLLVIDAMAIYPRPNRGGDLYGFELVDPGTIARKLDNTGRTPLPPDVAYQQILKGLPAVDYTSDTIVYTMRNPSTDRVYGYSPVEQVLMTVNIAMRRQLSQLDFYTSGNVPEALAQVPETWTPEQIAKFQLWWDSVMEGNMSARRKMRFMPSLKDIVFPKKETLKDEMDEWLARIICFAFSIPPTAFIKMVNRASGEQMSDTAKEEGLMPILRFLESHLSRLIQRYLNAPNLRFQFKIVNRVDPVQQAAIDKIYVDIEAITPDEVRERSLTLDPMTPQEREAAFPTPIPPGFNPDGTPLLPKGAPGSASPAVGGTDGNAPLGNAGKSGVPPATAAEKMLADALAMLDPEKLAKVAAALRPTVIEVRPEVNVEVGETNVHVPAGK